MQNKPITFLWPKWSSLSDSGITMKATGYEANSHWTGQREFARADADFPFWNWVYQNGRLLPPVMDESFIPSLKHFVSALTPDRPVEAPPDGLYLNRESEGPFVSEAIAALLEVVDDSIIIGLHPSQASDQPSKLLGLFCRGAAEVFVFKNGECDFFGAVGEDREGIAMNIRLITKRVPPTPDS